MPPVRHASFLFLPRARDPSAAIILAAVGMPRRALWTELAIFATNPWKED